jgi:hypothetical protein
VTPEADYASDSEEEEGEEEEEEEDEQRGGGPTAKPICRILWFLILTMHQTARRRRRERRRSRSRSRSSISRRLPSMTRHGKDPGDRRRSVS